MAAPDWDIPGDFEGVEPEEVRDREIQVRELNLKSF